VKFDPQTAHDILVGTIRQWRLPAQPGTRSKRRKTRAGVHTLPANQHVPETKAPAVGHAITISKHGTTDPVGHVLVTHCTRARHADTLTPTDLADLGHPTLEAYIRAWLFERDTLWLARRAPGGHEAHATYELAAQATLDDLSDDAIRQRFDARWAPRLVWAVHWQPHHDRDLYLAPVSGLVADIDELQAGRFVDVDDLDGRHERAAHQRWLEARGRHAAARDLAKRFKAA
jgi:hypothetical protein